MTKESLSTVALLGQTLRARRKELSLSQDTLSARSGVSRRAIIRIELAAAGEPPDTVPRLSTLDMLAQALQLDVQDLALGNVGGERAFCDQISLVRVAGNIARIRKELGLSQERLSGLSGRFREYVHRIEVLGFNPRISDLESITAALNCSVADLLAPIPEDEYKLRLAKRTPSDAPTDLQ
ncbi:XRE family transcriptional regulator [Paraburkholderia caledonica]|uniref:XRE family transcriptional regulator n=1 Tax=Paraburkholderia caledonica TaxID=134536 RepID=UPI000B3FF7E0|nr:XRE family transcriptional regulator [Paraburkholderia caledonica]